MHTYIQYALSHIHTYINTYIQTYIVIYAHTNIHTYIHSYIHSYIHTYIHTCIHTYIHTHIDRAVLINSFDKKIVAEISSSRDCARPALPQTIKNEKKTRKN